MLLVERDVPLQELEVAWRQAAGSGCFVLVSGEAGIGKTALVEAFARRYQGRPRLLWGACDALFTPRPSWEATCPICSKQKPTGR